MRPARALLRTSRPVVSGVSLVATVAAIVPSARSARADEPTAGRPVPPPTDPNADPATPPPPVEPTTAPPPAAEEGSEIVFHAAPRAPDMAALTATSMQQVHVGSTKARYAMNIFGDVDFSVGTESGTHPSFALGTLSFLITGELEKHFVSTAEFAFEYDDVTNEVGVDIERLHVGYLGEHFFVYAGRVHTAFGYWNNAYHHGKWLQPNMERPRWVAFEDEGGLLPIHTVGLSAGTNVDAGPGQLRIIASVSNARGNVVDNIRNTFDYQNGKAVHAQLEYVGLGLPELRAGVAGMYDHIVGRPATSTDGSATRPARPDTGIDEYILSAHIAYPSYPLLFIAEGYYVMHHVPDHLFSTYGGFATLGRAFGVITPYVRGEWIGTSGGSDPFFVPDPTAPGAARFDQVDGLVGIRWDLTDWTALRVEYRATKIAHDDVTHLGVVQWSWGF
jgi:hypothetical protein